MSLFDLDGRRDDSRLEAQSSGGLQGTGGCVCLWQGRRNLPNLPSSTNPLEAVCEVTSFSRQPLPTYFLTWGIIDTYSCWWNREPP